MAFGRLRQNLAGRGEHGSGGREFLSPFSWFIGAALSLVVHYYVSRNDPYVIKAIETASKVDLDANLAAVAR